MPSSRRAFLAAIGSAATVSVVGCMESLSGQLPVTDVTIGQSFEWLLAGVHWHGVTLTDRQYVFLDIPESAGVEGVDDVSLHLGETTLDPSPEVADIESSNIEYRRDSDGLKPKFVLPLDVDVDRATIETAGGASFGLGEDSVERLRGPPRLAVTRFEPAGMDGDDLRVEIAMENEGGHDAIVRGNLGSTTLSGRERVDFPIPAGETTTVDRSVNLFVQDGTETIRFDWGVDSRAIQVREDR